jgi:DNA (cytosine-5)-methyltransferase 1
MDSVAICEVQGDHTTDRSFLRRRRQQLGRATGRRRNGRRPRRVGYCDADIWDNFQTASGNVISTRLDAASGSHIFNKIGKIDLIVASPERTHYSVARGAKPRDEQSRRSGWFLMRFIEQMKPRWVIMENVTTMSGWAGFDELMDRLREDYFVSIQRLDASEFGVPQSRKRLFILCDRERPTKSWVVPAVSGQRATSSILWDLGYERSLHQRPSGGDDRARRSWIKELGKGEDFLVVYYGSDRAGGWQTLDRPLRTLTTLDRFGLVQRIGRKPTLRMLQVPEIKKAMGLSPSYHLARGTRRDKVKLLGNGVCAPVMKAVVQSLTRDRTR